MSSPSTVAVAAACFRRASGIVGIEFLPSTLPVASSSTRLNNWRTMRKLSGTTPPASPECTPSVSTSTWSLSADQPAQRGRQPELFVVAASGVERDAQAGLPDARREMLDVVRQIEAAAFLACLDDHDASRMLDRFACNALIAPRHANIA